MATEIQPALPNMDSLTRRTPAQTLADAIDKAIYDPNFDPQKLKVLMEMQIQWEDREKKRMFDEALERFRQNKTVIEKTKQVIIATKDGGQMTYRHAELEKANEIIEDALRAVGLSSTWEPDATPDGKPKMSLVVRGFGHMERMGGMVGPPDLSGSKNAMQAVGSSMKYLARYTKFYSLGIVPDDPDDDGKAATGGMSDEAIDEYCQTIKDATTFPEAKEKFAIAYRAGEGDQQARDRMKKVWEEKKRALMEAKRG